MKESFILFHLEIHEFCMF